MIKEIENLPDISFIENKTLADVRAEMTARFQERYEELTGKKKTLARADPITLLIYAAAAQIYQGYLYIDKAGKMDLLKYTYGEYLDNGPAALKGLEREEAEPAVVTVRFTLSAVQAGAIGIPVGTQVSNGDIYFVNEEYAEIPAGSLYTDVEMTCLTDGTAGNGIAIGDLNVLVDPLPYIEEVANITETAGGVDVESDDSLKERVYLAPASYSTAGPEDAYIYWAKEYSNDIVDVAVSSPDASEVSVLIMMTGGALPTTTQIEGLQDYLDDEEIRPLTDQVTVAAPDTTSYSITMTYYIGMSNKAKATTIQAEVAAAVQAYKVWQQSKIGRDIVPDQLINMIIAAGAKRVVLTAPVYTTVADDHVAMISGTPSVTYGGLEDD